jgi:hypothetical protein
MIGDSRGWFELLDTCGTTRRYARIFSLYIAPAPTTCLTNKYIFIRFIYIIYVYIIYYKTPLRGGEDNF